MARAERYAQVKALRDQGMLLREISEQVGLAKQTISDLLLDPSGAKARERKARYQTPCLGCGKLLNPGGRHQHSERCRDCNAVREREASRRWILESLHEWADLHGGIPPVAADWNPGLARQHRQHWRVARMEATGRPWPTVTLAQDNFGSWRAALAAAGFESFAPGCYGRDREDGVDRQEWAERYRAGESAYSIARTEGVSNTAVIYHLRKAGVEMRSHEEAAALRPRKAT